ncbi:uncharacterized protein PG998_014615 [Apiospora kogelbergensis]|uniref:uncharacterized protein n=1 Tax=Apiospora kogelbergensis TaxID=1337665 RepID=UPI003130FDB3
MDFICAGVVLVLLLWMGSQLWALNRNYRAARLMGLPIVLCPFDPDSVSYPSISSLYMAPIITPRSTLLKPRQANYSKFVHAVASEPLRLVLRPLLPTAAFAAFELTIWGWEFHDKAAVHERLGPAFVLVTTGLNQLICADPSMADAVLARRRDFLHPDITIKAMGLLGPNVVTNESWSRQRRIVAPALNERISAGVWKESADQASSFVDTLFSTRPSCFPLSPLLSSSKSTETDPSLRTIAINVLTRVAYGRHTPFVLPSSSRAPVAAMSYVDAISLVTELLVPAAFIPARVLSLPIMPRILQRLGIALRYAGQTKITGQQDTVDTIMRTLVRLSDQARCQHDNGSHTSLDDKGSKISSSVASRTYLTEEEIAGNLFIFTAAGFDTTSNTMFYAVTLLAAYPEWQSWVQAEIDTVLGTMPGSSGDQSPPLDYAVAFPKLTRCLAVMHIVKTADDVLWHGEFVMRQTATTQSLPSGQCAATPICVPAPCAVYVNTMALHTSTSGWGADALVFNPARWLQPGPREGAREVLVAPPRGIYLPWSVGPRKCPGQKMSQVEFVSVISTLFGRCTAEPFPRRGRPTGFNATDEQI